MKAWLKFLTPAPGPLALLSGALAVAALGFLAAAGYGLSAGAFLENFGFLYGLLCFPAVVALLAAAALRERQPLPRAALWFGTAAALVAGGFFAGLGASASKTAGPEAGITAAAVFCVPPAVLCGLIGVYFVARGLPAAQAALAQEREARALQLIEARGETTLAELAAELGLPAADCDALVDRLLRAGRLTGFFDAPRGRVYTAAALRAKQQRLVAVVQARGQMSFDDLAAELRAPRDLLRTWVYEAVRRGEFTGYLNWEAGLLYSAEAHKLGGDRCPQCGGALALAGQGVVQCAHCGSEIFRPARS